MKATIIAALLLSFNLAHAYSLSCSDPEQKIKITAQENQFETGSGDMLQPNREYTVTLYGATNSRTFASASYTTHAPHTAYDVYWVELGELKATDPVMLNRSYMVLCTIID